MKYNRQTSTPQQDVANIIESALSIARAVDGVPKALILPKGTNPNIPQLYAAGLKQLVGESIEQIVLVAEKTHLSGECEIFIQKNGHIDTPFGKIEVDTKLAKAWGRLMPDVIKAKKSTYFSVFAPILAFLKKTQPSAKILPVLLDPRDSNSARLAASTLAEILPYKPAVLIAISDMADNLFETVEFFGSNMPAHSLQRVEDAALQHHKPSYTPVVAALKYAEKMQSNTATVLKDFPKKTSTSEEKLHQASIMLWEYQHPNLSESQKTELINLAKISIRNYIQTQEIPKYTTDDPELKRNSGVFVTLRQKNILRGCIGRMQSDLPLYLAVQRMAAAAATSDPRFPPIKTDEIDQLKIKIAVLSPLKRTTIENIEIGTHGLMISHQGRRGVLLPDVPVGRGWDRETFLANLCLKAGLPPRTLQENPALYAFSAVEFGNH